MEKCDSVPIFFFVILLIVIGSNMFMYDFFMLFVVLCGLAGVVLYSLTPMMKKMMHGVR